MLNSLRKLVIDKHFPQKLNLYANSRRLNHNNEYLKQKQKELMARGLPKQKPIDGVDKILIVASGKGGVGKSTTAVNLAVGMKMVAPHRAIGLLDADVFGPSIPLMMNLDESPVLNKNNLMEPLVNFGIKCMSMGFLVDKQSPIIWRGLMVMSSIDKLLRQVAWGPLDYLVIDTPPGTGDTHLSLIQNLPIAGALLITTPQQAAIEITRRGAEMFRKLNIPIIGIVNNMTSIKCPHCKNEVSIFKTNVDKLASDLGIKIMCNMPLDDQIVEACDAGNPIASLEQDTLSTNLYKQLAKDVLEFLERPAI